MTDELDPKTIEKDLEVLAPLLIGKQVTESALFQQSKANGGPSNTHDAFLDLIQEKCQLTIRQCAAIIKVNRGKLQKMVYGDIPMSHDVQTKLMTMFRERRPDLFTFEKDPNWIDGILKDS